LSTTALLRDKLAPAVGRVLLRLAFGADVAAVGGATLDWLSGRLGKASEAREAERFARKLADGLVVDLAPRFRGSNPEAVALALGETLDAHVDGRFLARHDLNPDRASEALLDLRLPMLRSQVYAGADIELYRRVMPHLMRRLVHDAKRLPDFQVASAAKVLERLRGLADEQGEIRAAVGRLDRARAVWEQRRAEAWDDFERHYAEAVLDRWNKLELFGIDVTDEAQRRQKLSVAYIPLNLQSSGAEEGGVVSPEELLAGAAEGGEPLIILGEAGSGKTTLLRWAACHAIRRTIDPDGALPFEGRRGWQPGMPVLRDGGKGEAEEHLAWWARVPFLLRLREVKDGALPKEPDWPAKTAALPRDPPAGWLNEILEAGHGLVLVDGLDELGSEGREVARDTLRAILRDRRGNLVVLTSRPGALDETWFEGISCRVATIRAMAPAQREACITNWHEAVAQAKPKAQEKVRGLGKSLIAKLRRTPHLQEPTTNPLICAATCALHYGRDGYLPTGLVKLFDALIDMLIHERDERQDLGEQAHVPAAYRRLDLGAKRQLLETIAEAMVLCEQSERSIEDTLPCIGQKLQGLAGHREAKAENILDGLLLRSGLLRPSGSDAVDFLHNDFKEYLAAARILASGNHPILTKKEVDRDPWDRVFLRHGIESWRRGLD
jgi:predicted NACHT family NTPase